MDVRMADNQERKNATQISHAKTYIKRYASKEELKQVKQILLRKKGKFNNGK